MQTKEQINDKTLARKEKKWLYHLNAAMTYVVANHFDEPFTADALRERIDKTKELEDCPIFILNRTFGNLLKSWAHAGRIKRLPSYEISRRTHKPLPHWQGIRCGYRG
jgi:hypothetical protein